MACPRRLAGSDQPGSISVGPTVACAAATWLGASLGPSALAQAQLETTRIITGFAAGSTSDTICRRVAQKLQGDFAKAAVVENKTGAGGQIPVQTVKACL